MCGSLKGGIIMMVCKDNIPPNEIIECYNRINLEPYLSDGLLLMKAANIYVLHLYGSRKLTATALLRREHRRSPILLLCGTSGRVHETIDDLSKVSRNTHPSSVSRFWQNAQLSYEPRVSLRKSVAESSLILSGLKFPARDKTALRYSLAIFWDKGNLQMVVAGIEDTQPQILSRRGMAVIVLGLVAYLEWFGLYTVTGEDGEGKCEEEEEAVLTLGRGEKDEILLQNSHRSDTDLSRYYPPFFFGCAFQAWRSETMVERYRTEGSIENHRGEDDRTGSISHGTKKEEWSGFIAAPEVVFVRSAKMEGRRRKRPRKVASERASGHYAATIASLSTVCNVTCLRGLAEASQMFLLASFSPSIKQLSLTPIAVYGQTSDSNKFVGRIGRSNLIQSNNYEIMRKARRRTRIPETINESLLMNKIVGRVADRSACNRKENRIKRALNGAIIRGNGDEGAAEKRAKWTSWGGNGGYCEDVPGYRGELTRARNYDGPEEFLAESHTEYVYSYFLTRDRNVMGLFPRPFLRVSSGIREHRRPIETRASHTIEKPISPKIRDILLAVIESILARQKRKRAFSTRSPGNTDVDRTLDGTSGEEKAGPAFRRDLRPHFHEFEITRGDVTSVHAAYGVRLPHFSQSDTPCLAIALFLLQSQGRIRYKENPRKDL
ncbi:hypothetical protein EAG_06259 [Camponotus floridanus]|uniref:Uncharacterized protein n=1 Tax=Camponotus floridanus TaxID=104421 RepID=E2A645_CAMFO|nr:hypothetical protein EAG_06259 [Camponotus floridanus]